MKKVSTFITTYVFRFARLENEIGKRKLYDCLNMKMISMSLIHRLIMNIMNINSGITSETLSTLCVLAVLELKQLITTSCVAKMLLLSDRVSSIEFLKLMLNSEI